MSKAGRTTRPIWAAIAIVVLGLALRSLRLNWQPLWWDEGYSIYFATEPLVRMAWLTAHDIHPPLYYTLLHAWLLLWGNAGPVTDRLLSVLLGVAALPAQFWLGRVLFPRKAGVAFTALLLLAFSPIHIYYSQEVRMYGLGLVLGLVSSTCIWRLVKKLEQGAVRAGLLSWAAAGYFLAATAGLYTLYYMALLLAAHLGWAIWRLRRKLRALVAVVGLDGLIGLAYFPWLVYVVPPLIGYVGGKVRSDQDIPLGPLAYTERHLIAFTAGHVSLPLLADFWALAPATIALCALILGLVLLQTTTPRRDRTAQPALVAEPVVRYGSPGAIGALWTWLLVPIALGWLVNLRFPFFPAGGERLLLIALPYFLMLLAYGIVRTWHAWQVGKLALAALALNALFGILAFYTVPRHTADDYRPILGQIVQQGANRDTFLAIFPWQIGYWRAYTPQDAPGITGPQPLLLSDSAVDWAPAVQASLDRALANGVLWFPEPLTFGSTLPRQIEGYLKHAAANLENRWYSATRLTAWLPLNAAAVQPVGADFGPIRLIRGGVAPESAPSANTPIAVTLEWQPSRQEALNVSLRIQDKQGYVWSSREFEQQLPQPAAGGASAGASTPFSETLGLIVPVGLPPGGYQVAVSVQTAGGAPLTIAGINAAEVQVGTIEATQPDLPQSVYRLPIQTKLGRPAVGDGIAILGFSGADRLLMAGTQLAVALFLQNLSQDPPNRNVYVSLLDSQGIGAAGYEGWPLAEYPTQTWPPGALTQTPVAFYVPGALATGNYRLVAGFVDPVTGASTPPAELTNIRIEQRVGSFTRPRPTAPLTKPVQFGTHARLLGYDLATGENGAHSLKLYWEILQPLLPPHHIFVHVDDNDGHTVAQQDGPPATLTGPAPTGSWQPGEFLTTVHSLPATGNSPTTLRVGIYDPQTGVRLPATIEGKPASDNVALP